MTPLDALMSRDVSAIRDAVEYALRVGVTLEIEWDDSGEREDASGSYLAGLWEAFDMGASFTVCAFKRKVS